MYVINIRSGAPYDVNITRNGPWGNPFKIGRDGTRSEVIEMFRQLVRSNPEFQDRIRAELRGKVLGCVCKPKPCHGDVYVEICDSVSLEEFVS